VAPLIWSTLLDELILWKDNFIIRSGRDRRKEEEDDKIREHLVIENCTNMTDRTATFTYASDGNGVQTCLSRDMKLIIAPALLVGSLIALLT